MWFKKKKYKKINIFFVQSKTIYILDITKIMLQTIISFVDPLLHNQVTDLFLYQGYKLLNSLATKEWITQKFLKLKLVEHPDNEKYWGSWK